MSFGFRQILAHRPRPRAPRVEEVFSRCPACESHHLLAEVGEVFCLQCDWNSIEIQVEARIQIETSKRKSALSNCERETYFVQPRDCEVSA